MRAKPPRPTTARRSGAGVVLSLLFHAALIGSAYVTWHRAMPPPEESHAVPVDLITIASQTNVAAQAPPTPPAPPKPETPAPPPPLPDFQQAEAAPDIQAPKFKVQDTPAPPKPSAQDFSALLNKLTQPDQSQKNVKAGPRAVTGVGAASMMTANLSDALKSQIYRCWSPPVGAPNAADLVVDFDLHLNINGTVASIAMLPGTIDRASGNPYTRASADSASRAIYQCAPYRMPPESYSQWSQINPLRFDPRQMMNQ